MDFGLAFILGGLLACALWRPPVEEDYRPPYQEPGPPAVSHAFHQQWLANIERARQRNG